LIEKIFITDDNIEIEILLLKKVWKIWIFFVLRLDFDGAVQLNSVVNGE